MLKFYVILGVLGVSLVASFLSSDGGLSELLHLEKQIELQKDVLKEQTSINQALEKNIVILQSEPRAIESIAREQLGLVKPNEVFVEVVDYRDFEVPVKKMSPSPDLQILEKTDADANEP